jgi:hypothetical protein
MGLSASVALTLAVAFSLASAARGISVVRGRGSRRILWAHLAMTLVLWLAVPPAYGLLDGLLGGQNWANLISHLAFAPIFYWGGLNVALAIGKVRVAELIRTTGRWVLLACSALIAATFLLVEVPASSMGLDEYIHQPAVVVYKAASMVFPAWVAAVLAVPVAADARATPPGWQRRSKFLLAFGFTLLPAVPVLQLAPLISPVFAWLPDLLLYPSIACVLLGVSLAWVQGLASQRQRHHPAH